MDAFNKFVEVLPFHNDFKTESAYEHLKTNDFRYNAKSIPIEKLVEFMNGWSVLSSNLANGELRLAGRCCFLETKFNVILNFGERLSWIEAVLL